MENIFSRAASINRRGGSGPTSISFGGVLIILSLLITVTNAEAVIVTIDPGVSGTNTSYIQDFSVLDGLNGTVLNGQSQSLYIFNDDDKLLVAAGSTSFTVDLFINQSGAIGTWPTTTYSVTGYLIDAAGNPLNAPVSFPECGAMPAQFWPGWPFFSMGAQYLPATKFYESQFSGSRIYGNPGGYYINPIIFSGVHFDITYPNDPTNTVIGGRIVIANFRHPILISPNPAPQYSQYFVGIPNPVQTLLNNTKSDQLNMQLNGTPNFPYILQSATNLTRPINWQPVITNSADTTGKLYITLTNSPGVPAEFFRFVGWSGPLYQQQ
jgi:hypothetical protein